MGSVLTSGWGICKLWVSSNSSTRNTSQALALRSVLCRSSSVGADLFWEE